MRRAAVLSDTKTGTVKKLTQRGFGFIQVGTGQDIYFHTSQCVTAFDSLQEGERVSFQIEDSPKGLRAVSVTRL
jgi:CspA family cold shock protein